MYKGRMAPYVIKAVRPFTELLPFSTNQYCLRDGFSKKIAVLLDFVQMRGGGVEGPAQIFCHLLISTFLVASILPLFKKNFG